MKFIKINKIIILFLFICLTILHFSQLYSQHWSAVLDQDLIIIYNSLLFTSGLEQEYIDHPAFTTFLFHGFFYNILSFILNISKNINQILNSNETENLLQNYFFISRTLNFLINIFLIFILSKVLKKINIYRNIRYLFLIIFVISSGYISSFFFLRSEVLSLTLFLVSAYFILLNDKNLLLNSFISGVFFCLAMLSKIQIIFLFPYLLTIIALKNNINLTSKKFLNIYLTIFIFFAFIIYICIQYYLQSFPRFKNNHFMDLIFFALLFIYFFIISSFSKNTKNNLIVLSTFLNGFVSLIILLLILDFISLIYVNDFIFLRLSNPIHYMTEFTGTFATDNINIEYLKKIFFKLFSNYKFSFVELILISGVVILSAKENKYVIIFFIIFIFNSLIVNYRYLPVYHIYYMFLYLAVLSFCYKSLKLKNTYSITYLFLFFVILNSFNLFIVSEDNNTKLTKIFNRDLGMKNVCEEIKNIKISNSYENVEYIKYWHSKIDEKKILKICNDNLVYYFK